MYRMSWCRRFCRWMSLNKVLRGECEASSIHTMLFFGISLRDSSAGGAIEVQYLPSVGYDKRLMSVDYWFLLPVGVSIAFLAMSSGISAGNFWCPVYLLWTHFDAPVAFWMTLATMLCGYGSGVVRNLHQGTIHRGFIVQYLPLTVPAAVVGGYLSPGLNVS